jgi:hypothetical protein
MEQAKAAGLSGGDNWRKHTAAMLRARCSSALARAVYPDLMMGVYEHDEAREIEGGSASARRAPRPAAPAVIETASAPQPEDAQLDEDEIAPEPEAAPEAPSDEDEIEAWRERIAAAADERGLNAVAVELGKKYPKAGNHPVRQAVSADYVTRKAELSRASTNGRAA